ncbi:MAG TPA: ABC transporter ATP-binding protein [Acidobacteriota bacterium]|nr:ABC transporter ATP-binding protein [Acidobacteriota bacterium]
MHNWFSYLKRGLSRKLPEDRLAAKEGYSGLKANLQNLRPFVSRHWWKGLVGAGLIIFTSLLGFPQPLIMRYVVDDVILNRQLGLLIGAILLLIGIFLAEHLANLLQKYYFARFEQEVTLDIQKDLLDHTLSLPKSFFDDNQTGYLMSRLSSDVEGLRWFFSGTIVHIFSNTIRCIGGLGLLFYLEWRLAIGVLAILPFIAISVRYFSRKVHVLSHHSMEKQAMVSSMFQESLSSVSLIKAFSSEARTTGRLMSGLKGTFQISMEQSTVSSVASFIINSMPAVARGVVLALGAYLVIDGQWTLGSLLAFQAYLGYVFGPAQYLASANLELQNARASLERVSALFDIVPEEKIGVGKTVDRLKGEIEFKNVSFSYDDREPVLEDVSFRIHAGEQVAIVGPSGVGKTTLMSLILRFYRPASGEVYFDGSPATDYEVGSLRRRIGYVSQSTLLLSGTIMENLRYGNPEANEEQVMQATKAAGIDEFIQSLPAGYKTEIGEKGINLSEGQKQRLSIARALVKNPDILVLDEPTSALDSKTEKSIFSMLPSLVRDKTLFVAAHRLSTIKNSDSILLLNENRLIAVGTHQSLLETNEYYRSLVAFQQI